MKNVQVSQLQRIADRAVRMGLAWLDTTHYDVRLVAVGCKLLYIPQGCTAGWVAVYPSRISLMDWVNDFAQFLREIYL